MQRSEQNHTRLGKNKLEALLTGINEQLVKHEKLELRAERKAKGGYRLKAVAPNARANARGETLIDNVHPADIDTFTKGMMFNLATMGVKKQSQPQQQVGKHFGTIKRGRGRPRKQVEANN